MKTLKIILKIKELISDYKIKSLIKKDLTSRLNKNEHNKQYVNRLTNYLFIAGKKMKAEVIERKRKYEELEDLKFSNKINDLIVKHQNDDLEKFKKEVKYLKNELKDKDKRIENIKDISSSIKLLKKA